MPVQLKRFGRYELIRRVSLGGMAEVFKANSYMDGKLEKVVALKRLLPNMAENQSFIEMFLQEAKLASRLNHPNICRLYELGKEGGSFYLTMEYVYGRDLRTVLKALKKQKTQILPRIAAWIGLQVALGLTYAYHREDENAAPMHIVHRDISPQNVMIGFDGSVKIIDFGIAKAANTTVQTDVGILKGKYSYMSPEHAEREPLDARSDIWSLGVVLHELLNAKRLFIGDSMADTIDQVLHRPIPPLDSIPDALANSVMRMLERNRDRRFANHQQVVVALEETLATENSPVTSAEIAQWMTTIFPNAAMEEEDLADHELHRLLVSAEERGVETTDMCGEITSATEIYVADTTTQADYRAALERFMIARQSDGSHAKGHSQKSHHNTGVLTLMDANVWSDTLWALLTIGIGLYVLLEVLL